MADYELQKYIFYTMIAVYNLTQIIQIDNAIRNTIENNCLNIFESFQYLSSSTAQQGNKGIK